MKRLISVLVMLGLNAVVLNIVIIYYIILIHRLKYTIVIKVNAQQWFELYPSDRLTVADFHRFLYWDQ